MAMERQDQRTAAINYDSHPSQAVFRRHGHHVLLKYRVGEVGDEAIELAEEWAHRIDAWQAQFGKPGSGEWLLLRGIWVDNKHGNSQVYLELLHDRKIEPKMSATELKEIYNRVAGVDGRIISVTVGQTAVLSESDGFYPLDDVYYEWVRKELFWKA